MSTAAVGGQVLAGLLRTAGGDSRQRIDRALRVLVEQLGMEVAFVSEFRAGQRLVTHSVSAPGAAGLPVGTSDPVEETLCHLVAAGGLPVLIADAAADPVMAGHPHTAVFGLAAYAGLPLMVQGRVHGVLCCAATSTAGTLNARDEVTLRTVASYVAEVLADGGPVPADAGLRQLASAVAAGHDLQTLTRPLLHLLQEITGLDSTFLTLVDLGADELVIAYAHNGGDLLIPEGATASWQESLCRQALDEGRASVIDVPATWPSAAKAQQLGITSFVSVPVRDHHDAVVGTLCAASSSTTAVDEHQLAIMATFAQLLSAQLARESAHQMQAARAAVLEQRMTRLREAAERDPLTGLCNRAGIHRWLGRALDSLSRDTDQLAVAFVDLNRFKVVNDTYGHAAGDEILRRVAESLQQTGRPGDLYGRFGGDEFVVAALLPAGACVPDWTRRVRAAAVAEFGELYVAGSVGVITCSPDTAGGTVEELLDRADRAMYEVKHAAAAGSPRPA